MDQIENQPAMKTPKPPDVAELLDINVPASKASWFIAGCVILSFGLAGGLIVVIRRAALQRSFEIAVLAGLWLTFVASILLAARLWQRAMDTRAMRITQDNPDVPIRELISRLVGKRAWLGATRQWFSIAQALPKHNRVGVTIRSCVPKHTNPIEPITVTFEPRPLDEADESVVDLASAINANDEESSSAFDDGQAHKQPSPASRQITRIVRLGGGWWLVGTVSIIMVVMLWDTLFSSRISSYRMISLGILFVSLTSILFASPQEWLIVPGGILIRKGRRLSSKSKLLLFDRRHGVLIAHRLQKHHWLICVADANEAMRKFVTAHEATLLLRAWLSPIQPPPLERLSELGQSD